MSPTRLPQPAYVGIGDFTNLGEVTRAPFEAGVPYVSFLEVRQPAGSFVPHRDVDGFVYVAKGPHILAREDSDRALTLEDGGAAWADSSVTHQSPSADSVWYLVALRPITMRNAAQPFSGAKVLYASPDLQTPPPKPLVYELALITMEAGGRTSSHSHGGSESFYVMEGTVELALNNGTRTKVTTGQGASVKPGQVMQMHVVGDAPVRILTLFVTPQGEPWQTNLQVLP